MRMCHGCQHSVACVGSRCVTAANVRHEEGEGGEGEDEDHDGDYDDKTQSQINHKTG